MPLVTLSDAWEGEAERWAAWARAPGHDSYWRFHRDRFFELLPSPGRLTVDIGCGEGRVARDLAALGHRVVAVDASATLVRFAREADPAGEYRVADAAALPLDDGAADLAMAFMSLQDVHDMPGAVAEAARVLSRGGRLCLAIVHPINSAGKFETDDPGSPFVIRGSYLREFDYSDEFERDGLDVAFHSRHRSLEAYGRALEDTGLLVEAIREPPMPEEAVREERSRRWQRLPLFLHVRALKPGR